MQVAAVYSFNRGKEEVAHRYPDLLTEVNAAIKEVDSSLHKTKTSVEKTMPGRMLYSPRSINDAFKLPFVVRENGRPSVFHATIQQHSTSKATKAISEIGVLFERWTL